jgi:hypothetical protein
MQSVKQLSLSWISDSSGGIEGRPRVDERSLQRVKIMTLRHFLLLTSVVGLMPFALGQTVKPITSADANNHVGEKVTVCGKVVDTKIAKYALSGHGHPVNLDLDQPEPNPSFFLVAFGTGGQKAEQVAATYQGKQLCATGKVSQLQGVPFIMISESAQIQVEAAKK